MRSQPHRLPSARRAAALVAALALLLTSLPSAPLAAAAPAASSPVPANALFVAALDLRPDNPSLKVLVEQFREQERAVTSAMLLLLGQSGLTALATGLDLEDDVLPWLDRRLYLVGTPPAEEGKPPRLMLLAEVKDAARANQALDTVLPRAAATLNGKQFQRAIGDSLLRHLAVPGTGHFQFTLKGNALGISRNIGALEEWIHQPPAAEAPAAWQAAQQSLQPGLLTVGVSPALLGEQAAPAAMLGLKSAALSLSFSPAGGRVEIAADLTDTADQGPVGIAAAQLAQARIRGEALAALPASALGAATAASPGPLLDALGVKPLLFLSLGNLLGEQSATLMPQLRPAVERLLAGEVAVALLAVTPEPRWAAVLAAPDESTVREALPQLRRVAAAIPEATVTDAAAPLSGFAVKLPGEEGKSFHLTASGKRLLVASDPKTLQETLATAEAPASGFAAKAAFGLLRENLDANAVLTAYVDTPALARALAQLQQAAMTEDGEVDMPLKYVTRLTDALLLPFPATGLSVAMREKIGRVTLFQPIEWEKASPSTAVAALPAGVALVTAIGVPAAVRARVDGKESRCEQNMTRIAAALFEYAKAHNNRLPAAANWRPALAPYLTDDTVWKCPADTQAHPSGYALNSRLAGRALTEIPNAEELLLLYETSHAGQNPAGTGTDLAAPRHRGQNHFAFLDGYVELLDQDDLDETMWGSAPGK